LPARRRVTIIRKHRFTETNLPPAQLSEERHQSRRRMFHNRLFTFLLAWLVLFAQQGGVLHELGHAIKDVRYSQQDKAPPGGHADVCDQCLVFASGGAAIPPSPIHIAPATGLEVYDRINPPGFVPATSHAPYRSRAPPLVSAAVPA
jgi:hypothetical protein